jgi:hypothetical protein
MNIYLDRPFSHQLNFNWLIDLSIPNFIVTTPRRIATLGAIHTLMPPAQYDLAPDGIPGLAINESNVLMTSAFKSQLAVRGFPLNGFVRISDNTTDCRDRSSFGDCSRYLPFTLNLAQMNPSCPKDILSFSEAAQQSVTWNTPRILDVGGTVLQAEANRQSETAFLTGHSTTVSYHTASALDPSQDLSTEVRCSFQVFVCCFTVPVLFAVTVPVLFVYSLRSKCSFLLFL